MVAITGKKFSQLNNEQKILTRLPITGWMVNALFVNPLQNNLQLGVPTEGHFDTESPDGVIQLSNDYGQNLGTIPSGSGPIGRIVYCVNWAIPDTGIEAGVGVTILPYQYTVMRGMFGCFKIECTGIDEWTISVIENGVLTDNGLG